MPNFRSIRYLRDLTLQSRTIATQRAEQLCAPVNALHGQDMTAFDRGLQLYTAQRVSDGALVHFPEINLKIYTLPDARVLISRWCNGVICTSDNDIVEEPSCFRERIVINPGRAIPDLHKRPALEEAFIGFDRSTSNYYHWMIYALAKTLIGCDVVPSNCAALLPDESAYTEPDRGRFSALNFHASLALTGLEQRVTQLPQGLYPVKRLHFMWHSSRMPELMLRFPEVHAHFDRLPTPSVAHLPRRFFVSRAGAHDRRLTDEEQNVVDAFLSDNSIVSVCLEDMDLASQMALFRGAELVVAPHGAGLANLVFAPSGVRVLELNRQLDGQNHLRNCFYLISAMRGHRYAVLDLTKRDLTKSALTEVLLVLQSA